MTLGWQYVENTGHRMTDGTLVEAGQSVTSTLFLEGEYALTDRLAASLGLAYVSAKYTDSKAPPPPIPYLPVDSCHCWNSSLQDFTFTLRYRLGDDPTAVTPLVRVVLPSHAYATQGEAVVGRDLRELQVGLAAGFRLAGLLPEAALQASYTYAFVERPLGITNDRTNGALQLGYAASRRLFLHFETSWQTTRGGLRFGSVTGDPFYPPGEVDTPERLAEHDRLLRDDFVRLSGGLSYSLGSFDVFATYLAYVAGTDTHAGHAFTAGLTYYFGGR